MIGTEEKAVQVSPTRAVKQRGQPARWWLFAASILVFILALLLVKEGARPLAGLVRGTISVDSPLGALGFGWISATLVLSGSPIAATALAFLDAEVLTALEAFTMVAGSRLGASFIVLFLGFFYALRGRQRESTLGAGLLSLLVTQTIYLPAIAVGYFMLTQHWLGGWQMAASSAGNSPVNLFFDPILALITSVLPVGGLFPLGFGLIVGSFWLFDQALPEFGLRETSLGRINRLLYRPIVSFAMGAALTAVTMSVSVSLGLLVPLSNRGYVRQENAIPYIMGANITTFIDTLLAAALLANPIAVTVVLVQMASVTAVSLVILIIGFRPYERGLSRLTIRLSENKVAMGAYLAATLLIPFALLVFF